MMNRSMKDSGVEWIGDIPEYWNIVRVKRLFTYKKEKVGVKSEDYERLSLTLKGVLKRPKNDSEGLQPEKFSGYQIIEYNDLVFKLIDLENISTSRVGLSNFTGIVSPAYLRLICSDDVDSKFGYYFFISMWYQNIFNGLGGDGVRSNLNSSDLLNLSFVDVPKSEQQKIAAFLDEKVAHIDNIIEETKKSIENLKAYKQSLITETVTKGLNPNVEMKDSGIESIGEVPIAWNIEKVKFHSIIDPSYKENDRLPTKAQFVPMDQVKGGYLKLSEVGNTEDLVGKYTYFREGDIVIAKVRPSFENGNIAVATGLKNNLGFGTTEIFTLRVVSNKILTKFLFYYLRNSNFINAASSTMTGVGGLKRISSSFLMNYKIGIPSIEEQSQIVKYLDEKINNINSLLKQKKQLITELEAYKKSLIYEYVTGKKEVK